MSKQGKISSIMGAVVDIEFSDGALPEIYNAVEVDQGNNEKLIVEVAQHLGDSMVRAVAMDSTDGLQRGTKAVDTGAPISVPVGDGVLGRMFDLLGNTIDEKEDVKSDVRLPIHRSALEFDELTTSSEILETGIKVIDLMEPYTKGGKTGLFGGAGVGKTVLIQELIEKYSNRAWRLFNFCWCRRKNQRRNDLYGEMIESGVIDKTAMVFGQMNEPPGARLRVALSALTMAEYFRDEQGKRCTFVC